MFRWYVIRYADQTPMIVRTHVNPMVAIYPGSSYAIGPFRTKRAAVAMATYGNNNPHMQTVNEAERFAATRSPFVWYDLLRDAKDRGIRYAENIRPLGEEHKKPLTCNLER